MFVCAADWMWSASCGPSLARSTLCAASAPLSTHRTNANCTYCSQKGVRLWSFHTIVSCVIYSIDCFWNLLLRLLPRSSSKYLIKVAMPVGRQMDAVRHDRRGHMTWPCLSWCSLGCTSTQTPCLLWWSTSNWKRRQFCTSFDSLTSLPWRSVLAGKQCGFTQIYILDKKSYTLHPYILRRVSIFLPKNGYNLRVICAKIW